MKLLVSTHKSRVHVHVSNTKSSTQHQTFHAASDYSTQGTIRSAMNNMYMHVRTCITLTTSLCCHGVDVCSRSIVLLHLLALSTVPSTTLSVAAPSLSVTMSALSKCATSLGSLSLYDSISEDSKFSSPSSSPGHFTSESNWFQSCDPGEGYMRLHELLNRRAELGTLHLF